MKYILNLFLIALISSSEIINKSDEIKEFAEYEDIKLQNKYTIMELIGKIAIEGIKLYIKAKDFIIGTSIFKFIKDAIVVGSKFSKVEKDYISKGKALLQKAKIFKKAKNIFNKGFTIFNNRYKGFLRNTKVYKLPVIIDMAKSREIIQFYKKINDTYNKTKDTYDEIKNYYEQYYDIYYQFIKKNKTLIKQLQDYQDQEKKRTQAYQARLMVQKNQAFQLYKQLKNNNTMTLAARQVEINNHLNYMLNKGFITPVQKQQMSNIQPPQPRK